jgi:(2R)-sulfolactate sulfo-lyase subunit alpha
MEGERTVANSAKFCVHHKNDTVGVAVSEILAGETVEGWVMDSSDTLKITARANIPLGHKIALADFAKGDQVIKYNEPIGFAVSEIKIGEHVHIHNLRSARW